MVLHGSHPSRPARVLLAAAALAWAGLARGEVVHFTNPAPGQPGHFAWYGSVQEARYLNITAPAAAQDNAPGGASVAQAVAGLPTGGVWGQLGLFDGGSSDFARVAGSLVPPYDDPEVLALGHGGTLADLDYLDAGFYAWGYPPFTTSAFPEGAARYIGVLTNDGRFGWIEVERTGLNLNAVSWACQSEPGLPIFAGEVPTPSPMVVLALAPLTSIRRRCP